MGTLPSSRKRNFMVILSFTVVCVAALSWPTLYFHFSPLPKFDQALSACSGQYALVLGGRDGFSNGGSFHRRNYILIPSFFHHPTFVRVVQRGGGPPQITETDATFEVIAFLAFILFPAFGYIRKRQAGD